MMRCAHHPPASNYVTCLCKIDQPLRRVVILIHEFGLRSRISRRIGQPCMCLICVQLCTCESPEVCCSDLQINPGNADYWPQFGVLPFQKVKSVPLNSCLLVFASVPKRSNCRNFYCELHMCITI